MSMTPDYGEPWHWNLDEGIAYDRTKGWCPSLHGNGIRLVACLNACAGMADPAAEIDAMREAIMETASHLSGFLGFHSDDLSLDQVRALSVTLDKLKPFIKP